MRVESSSDAGVGQHAQTTTHLKVVGMTCSNCARHVREALEKVEGVVHASVSLEEEKAIVGWETGTQPNLSALREAVKRAGYQATLPSESIHLAWSPLRDWKLNAVLGCVATIMLMVGEWALQLGMTRWFHWVAFFIALPVQAICGARFYFGAWNQLKAGGSNMDTLVALGSTTAFLYSVWGLFAGWHTHLYFMEAAAIITLISIGHWLESIVSAKAASSLRALLDLAPVTTRRISPEGLENEVPVTALQINELVVLKPGDRVPTDGTVTEGNSAVDESMLTGESAPIEKSAGAKLYTGTVNQNGRLLMRVTETGESTALAHIIAVVQRAQTSRARIQKLGDRVSNIFVPSVVIVAIGTALWWGLATEEARVLHQWLSKFLWPAALPGTALAAAVIHAAGVLIVACPCAMGLATPAAIMAGTNVAARRGILIRDAIALEKSGQLTAVVFDKTGTLTEGKLSVVALQEFREPSARTVPIERMVALLAGPSTHPISRAAAKISERPPDGSAGANQLSSASEAGSTHFDDWQELSGRGVLAKYRSGDSESLAATWRLGSLNWLHESGVPLAPGTRFINDWSSQGATLVGLASDRELIGMLALRDAIKEHAATVVNQLSRQKMATYLISGDNRLTTAAIAAQAGIPAENVFAEIRPEQKAAIIQKLQASGERVAFVGDGINDAPALEQADLGIAVSRASDVAREAADIILLKSDLQAIPEALGLAQATLRTIKQNLFWAFFYNAAAVPLAAFGFLSPVLCAAAMGLSDLIVIGNALRLRSWKASTSNIGRASEP